MRSDFKRLFANAMSVIIVIGLVVMPSIFAWYNVIACWNVFDNTGNLTVAVATSRRLRERSRAFAREHRRAGGVGSASK